MLRQQQMDVGSLLLFRDLPQRVLFQNFQLKHQWHRWVYVALFAVLALIAAGLSLPQPGQRHIIVIDDSASLLALEDPLDPASLSFWERARAEARRRAEQSSALGKHVVLMRLSDFSVFGNVSSPVAALDQAFEENALNVQLATLDLLEARPQPVDLAEQVERLATLAGAQGVGRLTIITDHPIQDEQALGRGVEWVDVADGEQLINLAIVSVLERQNPFDRGTRVVIQNLSPVALSDIRLEIRSINNPVSLPLLSNIRLEANAKLELDVAKLRQRADALGSGPLRLSVIHPSDHLSVDNHIWLVQPSNPQLNVALVQCQGPAPLFDRLRGAKDLKFIPFGDVTSLVETLEDLEQPVEGTLGDDNGGFVDSLSVLDQQDGLLQGYDLVIYDRCELPPLYEELVADSIVIDTWLDPGAENLDQVDQAASDAVVRVRWQAPAMRTPVLAGVRSLAGLPLVSQTVRPLPDAHYVVGLLSDLDPNSVAGQALQDVFAPTDLLQAFLAWGGAKTDYDPSTDIEAAKDPDDSAPKMLFLGFDPNLACAGDPVRIRRDGVPLAEAIAAAQNGPDDCLALTLLVINTIEWMRDDAVRQLGPNSRLRQYFSTGESLKVGSAVRSEDDGQGTPNRGSLIHRILSEGEAGAARENIQPLAGKALEDSDRQKHVIWALDQDGLYQYSGTQPGFDLSVGLLDAAESRLNRRSVSASVQIVGADAYANRRDLVRQLVLLLLLLMLLEVIVIWVRNRPSLLRGSDPARGRAT